MSVPVHRLAGHWTPGLWSGNSGSDRSSAEMAATEWKYSHRDTLQVRMKQNKGYRKLFTYMPTSFDVYAAESCDILVLS